jgi:hypothetical protein
LDLYSAGVLSALVLAIGVINGDMVTAIIISAALFGLVIQGCFRSFVSVDDERPSRRRKVFDAAG